MQFNHELDYFQSVAEERGSFSLFEHVLAGLEPAVFQALLGRRSFAIGKIIN